MRVLMVTGELAPVVKVGGLADMTASLASALAARGHDVRVVLPLYGHLDREALGIRPLLRLPPLPLRIGQQMRVARWFLKGSGSAAVKLYFADNAALFGRPGVYTDEAGDVFPDAVARAAFHAQAALALPDLLGWTPQVIHAHDAAAALAPVYRRRWWAGAGGVGKAGTLLTIHNLAHQLDAPLARLAEIGLPAAAATYPGPLEFHGRLNLMKAGILESDLVNTVSPTYAREVVTDEQLGCGLDGVLRGRGDDFSGILNGADLQTWNPARDARLAARFDAVHPEGKQACRAALAAELGLAGGDGPVAGFVGRLVEQKGTELLLPLLDDLLRDGLRLVFLATGAARERAVLADAAARHPGRLVFADRFDEDLAHRVYAGCDLFLMPSRFEPCGLAQMYALRYGAVPVVRRTGGLADTVTDAARPDGTGFAFVDYTPLALRAALDRALALWEDAAAWATLRARGMLTIFPWDTSAAAYEALYARLTPPD
ncbi:MAG: glycogen synthase [Candidatus Krumholzibacteriia bacterium]